MEIQQINWHNLVQTGELASSPWDGRDDQNINQAASLVTAPYEADQTGMLGETDLGEQAAGSPFQAAVPAKGGIQAPLE